MPKNIEAIEEAMTWLGTPYHHQGRVKGVGVEADFMELFSTYYTGNFG
ncbi:hypothetical protein [Acinetobacter bohemicus]|nr:hypothetical protein [Acinetobacter bohemicus]CAD9197505.1 hypothetical protein QAC21B_03679 [Acinetobacter bohemicus]